MTTTNIKGKRRDPENLSKLPPDIVMQIHALAEQPEYQHGTGCGCHKHSVQKHRCPGYGPVYKKIARVLGTNNATVHCYLDDDYKDYVGKKRLAYRQKEEQKEYDKNYSKTEAGKGAHDRSQSRYKKKEKHKDSLEMWRFINGSSLEPAELNIDVLELRKRKYIDFFNEAFDAGIEYDFEKHSLLSPHLKKRNNDYYQNNKDKIVETGIIPGNPG